MPTLLRGAKFTIQLVMGIIDIFCNGSITFRKSSITSRNDPQRFRDVMQRSETLRYALYKLQLAPACMWQSAFSDVW